MIARPDSSILIKQAAIIAMLMMLFFLVLYLTSPSVRGSDQYWYVGDLERVALQDGLFRTNSIFPASLPQNPDELPRPWVQNKPISYIVLVLTFITRDGHVAWLLLNAVCLFFTAFVLGRLLSIDRERRFLFLLLFLFFPFNFYLATQALPEVFLMAVIAAIHYLVLSRPLSTARSAVIAVLCGVLICHRANFFLLLVLLPPVFYVLDSKNFLRHVIVFLTIGLLASFGSVLFSQHLIDPPSTLDVIVHNMPGVTNMGSYFPIGGNENLETGQFLAILFEKFVGAMKIQFSLSDGGSTFMFYIINLLLAGIPLLLAKKSLIMARHAVCMVFIIVHFATIVLFFNQYRYAAAIIPSLFILNSDLIGASVNRKKIIFLSAVVAFVLISVTIGIKIHKEAETDRLLLSEVRATIQKSSDPIMCVYNPAYSLAVGYAASPTLVYFFWPKSSFREWHAVAKKLGSTRGIISSKSRLYSELKPYIVSEKKLTFASARYVEFNLP